MLIILHGYFEPIVLIRASSKGCWGNSTGEGWGLGNLVGGRMGENMVEGEGSGTGVKREEERGGAYDERNYKWGRGG